MLPVHPICQGINFRWYGCKKMTKMINRQQFQWFFVFFVASMHKTWFVVCHACNVLRLGLWKGLCRKSPAWHKLMQFVPCMRSAMGSELEM